MCGIAGIVSVDELDAQASERALAMRDVMTHRGPDDAGWHADSHTVLTHRRLSIVDISGGSQPLSNEDGNIWVSFNGEIYNHRDIRHTLETCGHRYRTRTDSESIVHAYEQWGDECVHRFRGMFAFALWDAPNRRLLLVRDRLGIKPLYWARVGDCLLFASEIKALLASGILRPEANHDRLSELLSTRYISGPETLFRHVYKLLPGHSLTFERGTITVRQYWDVPAGPQDGAQVEPDTVVPRFRALLEESVRLHLMSDVPLGIFLSGGLDSSAIAAIMARQIDRPLQTFSVAFREQAFNELSYARTVAQEIHADSHEIVIDDRDFFAALPKLVWHEDEPIAHPSSVPLYFVSSLARRHVKVVLTGEGSDELFAGYGKYAKARWNWHAGTIYERTVPVSLRARIASDVVPVLSGLPGRYARRSFLAMPRTSDAMVFDNFAAIGLRVQGQLLTPRHRPSVTASSAYGASLAHFDRPSGASTFLDRMLYADVKTYLVELLMKQDQMSMATSLESRVPFLDHELVEFAARLPDSWKLSGLTTKRILRVAMRHVLPKSILRRPKMGFPVPLTSWTRGPWNSVLRDVLLDSHSRQRGIVDAHAVDDLLASHAAGRCDHGDALWSLLNLELWHRTFIDNQGVQTLSTPHTHPAHSRAHTLAEIRSAPSAR